MGKRSLETSGVPGKRRRKSLSGEKQETDRPKLKLPQNFSSFTPSTLGTPENCENVRMAQRGIFDFLQKHGLLCTANFKSETTKADVIALYGELLRIALASTTKTRVIVGFDPRVWKNWNPGMELELRPESQTLLPYSTKLVNDGKDVLFYIKSDDLKNAMCLLDVIKNSKVIQLQSLEIKHSDENGNHGILGGEYREGLSNVSSLEALSDSIVIDETGKGEPGGTYILNQIFQIDWTSLRNAQQSSTVETIVGRKMFDFGLETTKNRQCHIVRVNEVDFDHQPINISSRNKRIFRQTMPYGKRKDGGREEGIMFIATANSTKVFTDLLKSMIGNFGTCEDALLNYMVSNSGSFYYAPSINELNCSASGFCRLQIDPFWQLKPKNNDFLFYNHREYLHRMSKRDYPDPPSSRVIRLMDFTMENWRKSWFQHIPVPDIPDLGSTSVSIQIRKSLAIKKTLSELVTTDDIPAKLEKGFYGVSADVFFYTSR